MTAYDVACWVLGFLLALYLAEWLGVVGIRVTEAIRRAHLRGLERVAFYDEARRQAELAIAVHRHPSGFLPT